MECSLFVCPPCQLPNGQADPDQLGNLRAYLNLAAADYDASSASAFMQAFAEWAKRKVATNLQTRQGLGTFKPDDVTFLAAVVGDVLPVLPDTMRMRAAVLQRHEVEWCFRDGFDEYIPQGATPPASPCARSANRR